MSIEFARLELLRRRDNESVVPLVLLLLVVLWLEILLRVLTISLKLVLLSSKIVSCLGDEVGGKKNRPGAPLLLRIASIETMGLGRKIIVESLAVSFPEVGINSWLLGEESHVEVGEESTDKDLEVLDVLSVSGLLLTEIGDFAVGVWKKNEDAANLFAYCRSNRERVGDGRGTRIVAPEDCAEVVVDAGFGINFPRGEDNDPW
jgi:hypothetical protein